MYKVICLFWLLLLLSVTAGNGPNNPPDGAGSSKVTVLGDSEQSFLLRRWRGVTCDLCVWITLELQDMIRKQTAVDVIVKEAIKICILFKIEDARVCSMIVPLFHEEILYVVDNLVLDPKEACGIILGDSCGSPYYPGEMWNITLPNTPKPPPQPPTPPKPSSPTVRFLHLTDIHWDFDYRQGANPLCGEPLCCRASDNSTAHTLSSSTAGRYGDFNQCDAPVDLLVSLFKHLSTIKDQFDYIIMTGDVPAHDVWNQTKTDQIAHVAALDKLFSQYLPDKPVYSCIGNHESTPVNSFPPPGISGHNMDWLYGALANSWGKWLSQSAIDTILSCGGYSFSPYPGFRIISINNNYCNNQNWWLLINATDPCNVLHWLVAELQKAEDKHEKVHMLMHIPPGDGGCLKAWSWNYYKIVNRYENTIVNQFYGHSHHDWFQMFYDETNFQRPVGFGFVAPSITPGSNINPIFRIYTMDGNYTGSSWAVLDYDSIYLNLTEANQSGYPTWKYSYSPKKLYNMTSLYAADWNNLINRLQSDDHMFQIFNLYRNNLYPSAPCEDQCKKDLLCEIISGRSNDPDLCKKHNYLAM
ncbi:sphingomyelin phosphodiesterase-like [Physella acuta]|uniref:sphingomyelin phosphodiesterase-like n=1 Tax=Physella acuta TaxID=109671 RepID=UPI0027DE506D|nr:sphingomyelin phosphodiesterase-like [Physella acuta]